MFTHQTALMGTISSQVENDDTGSESLPLQMINTEIKVDFTKDVSPNLKQLLYCMKLYKIIKYFSDINK